MPRTAVGFVLGPGKFLKGYTGKGTPKTAAGHIDVDAITGAPTTSIVFGIADKMPILMRKKRAATGYEYEMVDPDNIGAMKAENYEVVSSGKTSIKTLGAASGNTVAASNQSKVLHVKITANIGYQWSQSTDVYNKAGIASARTRLGQVDGAVPNQDEMVKRASGFILNTAYSSYAAGTYIPINGIKAKYRYAPATPKTANDPGSSGIYSSFASDSAWTA